jgi:hypothetical protein
MFDLSAAKLIGHEERFRVLEVLALQAGLSRIDGMTRMSLFSDLTAGVGADVKIREINGMFDGPILPVMVKLGFPILLANFFNYLYNFSG